MSKQDATLIDPDAIGVEVSWSFGNGDAEAVTVPRDTMRGLLIAHGFDPALVAEINEDRALRKAQHVVKGRSKEIVIQELRRPNKDTPRAFGVYRVIGREGEAGDEVRMGARVRCEAGRTRCLPPEGETQCDPACEPVAREIERIANSLIDNVINRDISDILVAIGWFSLAWISRRRHSGGVYFVGSSDVAERFVQLLQALQVATHELSVDQDPRHRDNYHFVPQVMEVYPKPLTMNMWSSSARDQYAAQTEKLVADLRSMQEDGTMRESTIQARADECDRLMRLAEQHRVFLADKVEAITAELTRVRDEFRAKLDTEVVAAKGAFAAIDEATGAPPKRRRRRKPVAKEAEPEPQAAPDLASMSADELFG